MAARLHTCYYNVRNLLLPLSTNTYLSVPVIVVPEGHPTQFV